MPSNAPRQRQRPRRHHATKPPNACPTTPHHCCTSTTASKRTQRSTKNQRPQNGENPSGIAQTASSPSLSVQLRSPPSKSQEDMKPRRNALTDLRDALHGRRPARTKANGTVRPLRQSGTAAFEKTLINDAFISSSKISEKRNNGELPPQNAKQACLNPG